MAQQGSSRNQPQTASIASSKPAAGRSQMSPAHDVPAYLEQYARERPEMVALCCFCVGFVLGWKLKPW